MDVKFSGKKLAADEETLRSETQLGDEDVDEVSFGLGDMDCGPLMDTDSDRSDIEVDEDDDDDNADANPSASKSSLKGKATAKAKPKQKKKKGAVEEVPAEVGA